MRGVRLLLLLLSAIVAASCGATASRTPQPPPKTADRASPPPPTTARVAVDLGRIVFDCEPQDATVKVDSVVQGTVRQITARGGLALPAGVHRFEVSQEGFHPFRIELAISAKRETIRVRLLPLGP